MEGYSLQMFKSKLKMEFDFSQDSGKFGVCLGTNKENGSYRINDEYVTDDFDDYPNQIVVNMNRANTRFKPTIKALFMY